MNDRNERSTLGQIINWFFDCAADGTQSLSATPKSHEYLRNNRSLVDNHIPGDERRKLFFDVGTLEMQSVIDETVSAGSETAGFGLRNFFVDLDKFAVFKGVIQKSRTHKLLAPIIMRRDKALSDAEFANAWAALVRNADGVGLPVRLTSLAVLLSTATLQPLPKVLKLRSEWVLDDGTAWIEPETSHYVLIPEMARPLVEMAEGVGDLAHREVLTPFVFPSVGPKSASERAFGISQLLTVSVDILGKQIKPQDLRQTGLAALRSEIGVPDTLMDRITTSCPDTPDTAHIAVVEAWGDRIAKAQQQAVTARWH